MKFRLDFAPWLTQRVDVKGEDGAVGIQIFKR